MFDFNALHRRHSAIHPFTIAAAALVVILAAAATPAGATAKLWLYPDSEDPRAGGHVVTEPAFTLNIENRGTGNGDNTATETTLIVAVNDPALVATGSIALPGGTVELDPSTWVFGIPTFGCTGKEVPPHGIYPAYFQEFTIGDVAEGEIVSAGVVIDGSEGLRVHFDAKAVGYKQTGNNLRCYDVLNPSGHDVTLVIDEPGGSPCHEIAIEKTAGATGVAIGDAMDYAIVIENRGTCELTDLVLIEDLPTVPDANGNPVPAFTVTAIDPPPTSQTTDSIVWNIPSMAPGDVIATTVSVVFDQPDAAELTIDNTACVTSFELTDPACSTASVSVAMSDGDEIGGAGFWCNQLRFAREGRPNAKFSLAELEAWLLEIFDGSAVFPELWPLATLMDAENLLCHPNQAETVADRLARQLLALWFNIVSERLPLDTILGDLCPGDEDPPPDIDPAMTVEQLVAAVEADLVAGADEETLEFWLEVVDFVNNSFLPGSAGCDEEIVRQSRSGRRVGNHRP